MTGHTIPVRGQTATFSANGAKQREGMLLLYPDKLIAVKIGSVKSWIYVLAPAVYLGVYYLLLHRIGFGLVAIWYLAAWWVWQAMDKKRAARKAAAGGDGVTVIPLGQVTSVQCRKARKGTNWLGMRKMTVTTADGTEYRFDGLMEQWHDHLARALTAHGREVYVAPGTITVLTWATSGES